jgi:hypothetical protein
MKNLTPTEDTYWFAYEPSTGILQMGVTEPGLTTSTLAEEFEYGPDVLAKINSHKNKLRNPVADDEPAKPGFYLNRGKIKLLKKEHCIGKANLYQALEDHPDNEVLGDP